MKKVIYALMLPMVVLSGIVFANRDSKKEIIDHPSSKPVVVADTAASSEAMRKWKATLNVDIFEEWVLSFERERVLATAVKIRKHLSDFTDMQAVVTSLSIPARVNNEASAIKGIMVSINGQPYIVQFSA